MCRLWGGRSEKETDRGDRERDLQVEVRAIRRIGDLRKMRVRKSRTGKRKKKEK